MLLACHGGSHPIIADPLCLCFVWIFHTVASKINTELVPTGLNLYLCLCLQKCSFTITFCICVAATRTPHAGTTTERKLIQKVFPICICICI